MLTLNVNIIIRDENGICENSSKTFQISPEEEINSLVKQISTEEGKNVKLLFAGKLLNKHKRLIDYHLASSTYVEMFFKKFFLY